MSSIFYPLAKLWQPGKIIVVDKKSMASLDEQDSHGGASSFQAQVGTPKDLVYSSSVQMEAMVPPRVPPLSASFSQRYSITKDLLNTGVQVGRTWNQDFALPLLESGSFHRFGTDRAKLDLSRYAASNRQSQRLVFEFCKMIPSRGCTSNDSNQVGTQTQHQHQETWSAQANVDLEASDIANKPGEEFVDDTTAAVGRDVTVYPGTWCSRDKPPIVPPLQRRRCSQAYYTDLENLGIQQESSKAVGLGNNPEITRADHTDDRKWQDFADAGRGEGCITDTEEANLRNLARDDLTSQTKRISCETDESGISSQTLSEVSRGSSPNLTEAKANQEPHLSLSEWSTTSTVSFSEESEFDIQIPAMVSSHIHVFRCGSEFSPVSTEKIPDIVEEYGRYWQFRHRSSYSAVRSLKEKLRLKHDKFRRRAQYWGEVDATLREMLRSSDMSHRADCGDCSSVRDGEASISNFSFGCKDECERKCSKCSLLTNQCSAQSGQLTNQHSAQSQAHFPVIVTMLYVWLCLSLVFLMLQFL